MGFLSFGKRPKHRSFDYIPRYYDPEKEELQGRLRKYKADSSSEVKNAELAKQRIRGGFRRNSRASSEATKIANKRSNMRLLLILASLLLMSFYFIDKYLPKIVAAIESTPVVE